MSKKITALIPGAALALGIACIAKWLETLESSAGLHLIGASVIALFIGMAINAFFQPNKTTAPGIKLNRPAFGLYMLRHNHSLDQKYFYPHPEP